MDAIHIKNLEFFANHGVFAEETALGQKFVLDADLYTDFSDAAKDEDLTKSIHYGEACDMIVSYLQGNTYKLIETAATRLAEYLLLNVRHLKAVRIELKKPWAPIKHHVDTVSVEVTRAWHTCYLSVGSNMGDKQKYLENCFNALTGAYGVKMGKISPIYETAPYGGVEQDNFLNCCLMIKTILSPEELLKLINSIEEANGRERALRWGPRTLDIDILLYDDEVIHSGNLNIPHVDMANRMFVLKPLADIAPYAYNPVLNDTAEGMMRKLAEKELKNN